jgi:hypothetical protein
MKRRKRRRGLPLNSYKSPNGLNFTIGRLVPGSPGPCATSTSAFHPFVPPRAPSAMELGAWIFHHFAAAILIGSTQLHDAELGRFAGLRRCRKRRSRGGIDERRSVTRARGASEEGEISLQC